MTGSNCKILCYRKNVFDLLLHMANIFDKLNSKKYCINYYYSMNEKIYGLEKNKDFLIDNIIHKLFLFLEIVL